MLQHLSIRDFAILERLELSWEPGLNVLTGETGAGKSIIVDAIGAVLGDRLGPEHVRSGAAKAVIEAVFEVDLSSPAAADLLAVLEERGLLEDGDQLIVSREVAGSGGRSQARVNGHAVPLSVLAEVGAHLLDVHGQSQHLSLLRPREQLLLLDRFAGLVARRDQVATLVAELRKLERELQELTRDERQSRREEDLLRHEIAEIEAAAPRPREEQELQQSRARLRNVERLRSAVVDAYSALHGSDEQRGAVELLEIAAAGLRDVERFDPSTAEHAAGLEQAAALAEEAARALSTYLDRLEADPAQLERAEERLLQLADLKRKYGDDLEAVLSYLESARQKLSRLEHREERLAEVERAATDLRRRLGSAASQLSTERRAAARQLATLVERELADLRMGGTSFVVDFQWQPDPAGVPVSSDGEERTVAFDASGIDRAEFLVSANPGEAPRPLARVASGGELARVSLALKAVLSRADPRPTLIFDEVDVGVGGRTGAVVGEKLWALGRDHQVLCITHLPQVAAFADLHLTVAKIARDGSTQVQVERVLDEARVAELAAMMSGSASNTAARESARELLRQSDSGKVRQ